MSWHIMVDRTFLPAVAPPRPRRSVPLPSCLHRRRGGCPPIQKALATHKGPLVTPVLLLLASWCLTTHSTAIIPSDRKSKDSELNDQSQGNGLRHTLQGRHRVVIKALDGRGWGGGFDREQKGCRGLHIVGPNKKMVFGVDLGGGCVKNQPESGSLPWF